MMLRGASGAAGAGIHFVATLEDALRKARAEASMVHRCRVRLCRQRIEAEEPTWQAGVCDWAVVVLYAVTIVRFLGFLHLIFLAWMRGSGPNMIGLSAVRWLPVLAAVGWEVPALWRGQRPMFILMCFMLRLQNRKYTFTKLLQAGFDSVHLTWLLVQGDEFIVYNFDQVEVCAVLPQAKRVFRSQQLPAGCRVVTAMANYGTLWISAVVIEIFVSSAKRALPPFSGSVQ